jgi:hypothetical protein
MQTSMRCRSPKAPSGSVRVLKDRVGLLVHLLTQSKRSPITNRFLSTEMRSLERDLHTVKELLNEAVALSSSPAPTGGGNRRRPTP